MGYTTTFEGSFKLSEKLTDDQRIALVRFASERHDGDEFPGAWCDWTPTADGAGIVWNGSEKFYDYVDWLKFIIENFLKQWGLILHGEVTWSGERCSDIGKIVVFNNVVAALKGRIVYG